MFEKFRFLTLATVFALGAGGMATAASYGFTAQVQSMTENGTSPGNPVIAPIGSPGMVTLEIDDSDPSLLLFDPDPVSDVFTATVTVPGYFDGEVTFVDYLSSFTATASYLQFTSYGPTSYVDTGVFDVTVPNGYHSFRINYGLPLIAVPLTVGDVVAGLAAPGASGFFVHEAELVDTSAGEFGKVRTTVAFPADGPTDVPLPAAGWLLIAGLLGLGILSRRG